jgi:hypothetical protein
MGRNAEATQTMLDHTQNRAEAMFGLDQFIGAMLDFLLLHRAEAASSFNA